MTAKNFRKCEPLNWELPNWPTFTYDSDAIVLLEKQFLLSVGRASAYVKTVEEAEYQRFVVEILSLERLGSSRIEGEILDRQSLQSSIKKNFGLLDGFPVDADKEERMAGLLCDLYGSFDEPLSHDMLWRLHAILFEDGGKYRSHPEPMQIVSNCAGSTRVFFEAVPSANVLHEMDKFLIWFNTARTTESILGRAAIAHLYFESIHPLMMHRLSGQINARQEKALLRMFAEGSSGFQGGFSAENYLAITKTTRATATRDLNDLVEKEALEKSGELRHTRYRLNL